MSAATLKAAALALLAGGAAWCKGANARTAAGLPCSALSPLATKWDVEGALLKAHKDSGDHSWADYHTVYAALRAKIPGTYKNADLESVNDSDIWSAIAALFT